MMVDKASAWRRKVAVVAAKLRKVRFGRENEGLGDCNKEY